MNRTMGRLAAIAVFLIAQAGLASADEVKVFRTIGVQTALEELAPKFEQASGHKLISPGRPLPFWSSVFRPVKRPISWCD
jgi:hypothetical protein